MPSCTFLFLDINHELLKSGLRILDMLGQPIEILDGIDHQIP